MCVWGSIQTRSWTDKQGQKRYSTDVVADEVFFVDNKTDNGVEYNSSAVPSAIDAVTAPCFDPLTDDEDLPFR